MSVPEGVHLRLIEPADQAEAREELLRQAARSGVRSVVLETTETWHDVIRFYQGQGFTVTHHAGGNVSFVRELGE